MRFYPIWERDFYKNRLDRLKFGCQCVICGALATTKRDLCDVCESLLVPRVLYEEGGSGSFLCLSCGTEQQFPPSLAEPNVSMHRRDRYESLQCCYECVAKQPLLIRTMAPFRYQFPLDKLIHGLKYANKRVYARILGSLLAAAVVRSVDDKTVVVPVPMSRQRQKARGYNHAAYIANWCARDLGLECWPKAISREADTGSLAGLSRGARELAILGAFKANEAVLGKRIALVDDVLTTGATTRELARELYDSGALSVELWVVARTSKDR